MNNNYRSRIEDIRRNLQGLITEADGMLTYLGNNNNTPETSELVKYTIRFGVYLEQVFRTLQGMVGDAIGMPVLYQLEQLEKRIKQLGNLTPTELNVLRILTEQGRLLSNKEIAAKLHIEPQTVKNHLHHIYKKLDVTGTDARLLASEWYLTYHKSREKP